MNYKSLTYDYKRVYVWQIPVRFFHWINVACILVLGTTGFIIADPPALNIATEASNSFWFGYIRLIHFGTAFIFISNIAIRLYWSFVGNKFSSLRNFIPYTKKRLKNLMYVLRVDILLMKDKEESLNNISIGHNAVAGLSYFILMLLFFIQIGTGLALYAPTSTWFFPHLFTWVTDLLGSESTVRYFHHIITWFVIVFTIIHMYLVFYHDYMEGRGETSSMISGFKFVLKKRIKKNK